MSDSSFIKKFFPTAEECKIKNSVKCTQENCNMIFTSESNLRMHFIKTHKRSSLVDTVKCLKQYYCPGEECPYSTIKHFKNMKSLRQHFLKVHVDKQFICNVCQKGFPSEKRLSDHEAFCGVSFTCCECDAQYGSYETLKTHGRRKNHKILTKTSYVVNIDSEGLMSTVNQIKFIPIIPRTLIFISTRNQACQANLDKPTSADKITQVGYDLCRTDQSSVQTQTAPPESQLPPPDFSQQKNSDTQTDIVESQSISCNTSFNLDDFVFSDVKSTSSSTQTNLLTVNRTFDSIHTDTSDLEKDVLANNFEFDNCHTETQTDFLLDADMFNCDYLMSNMYTQTCDDIFNHFGFSDIQTQTVFDDILKSVESQTTMSQELKDMSHMETQTDIEFKQMLEVINS